MVVIVTLAVMPDNNVAPFRLLLLISIYTGKVTTFDVFCPLGEIESTVPVNCCEPYALTVNGTGSPGLMFAVSVSLTLATTCTVAGSISWIKVVPVVVEAVPLLAVAGMPGAEP